MNCEIPPLRNFLQLLSLTHVQRQYFAMVRSPTPPVCVLSSEMPCPTPLKTEKIMTIRFFTKDENHQKTLR